MSAERAAIYARYSDEEQRATSIDDQIRRCKEHARQHGYEVAEDLIFTDAAISGSSKGLKKRDGFKAMLQALGQGQFQALVVDEVSRLARDMLVLADLQRRIEATQVRLLATDGLDSKTTTWKLQYGILGVLAEHFLHETRHRVIRGMNGQLERGYMVGYTAYGYRAERVKSPSGEELGTQWIIVEKEASLIRSMFAQRRQGLTFGEIALELNRQGIRSPRKARSDRGGYWRAATVCRLMANPIYKGITVWNGSSFTKFKAKREGRVCKPVEYPRPELRIIDDESWEICNSGKVSRSRRGGDRHLMAGLLSCGVCEASLTVSTGGCAHTLYCTQCATARRVGAHEDGKGYASVSGVKALLKHILTDLLQGEALETLRNRLRARLERGLGDELHSAKDRLARAERQVKHLVELLANPDFADDVLKARYQVALAEKNTTNALVRKLEAGLTAIDRKAIERQVQVEPGALIDLLFSPDAPAHTVRAVLSRLFPRIVLLGKPARNVALFEVHVVPGAALAELTDSAIIEDGVHKLRFRLETGAERPTRWRIVALTAGQIA